ncbi:MAG: acyloxyacyl hydrolase [Bacteroidota bacterium]
MKSTFFLLFLSLSVSLFAQEEDHINPTLLGLRANYGFIIPHSSELRDISESSPWGIQLDWSKLMTSRKSWDNCNCYAQTGLSFYYFNYSNPEQLGNSYNLVYFAEPYLNFKRRLFYSFRAGGGISVLDQVYDETENPENTFYSSTLSFIILLNFNINYRITDKYTLSVTGSYNHISNGGMKQPNRGINFPTVGLGLTYSPRTFTLEGFETATNKKGDWQGYARLFGTLPNVSATEEFPDSRKLLLGISGGALWYFSNFNAFNIGIEAVRDESYKERAERANDDFDFHSVGLVLGNNFIFGKFTLNQQMGYYLYRPFPTDNPDFFQRYELLYQIGKRYQVGTSLKAHGHVAENLDIRFGILF